MKHLYYEKDHLKIDGVALTDLAESFDTPLYVYSRTRIEACFRHLSEALGVAPDQLCYGVKANSNLAVLQVLSKLGAGFDVVSGGELERVLAAGADVGLVIFSGVGKTSAELRRALELNIRCINVESEAELTLLSEIAREMKQVAPVSLRINPDIDVKSHPYITTGLKNNKFGIDMTQALALYQRIQADAYLRALGIDCHIGSQIAETDPLLAAADCLLSLADELANQGIHINHLDLGGGFGIRYQNEKAIDLHALAAGLSQLSGERPLQFLFEPGRYLTADAGILLAKVLYTKQNGAQHFTVIDAAMNDLLRPSLYQAWHDVMPETASCRNSDQRTNLVGPICESGDFLALDRQLNVQAGDLVALTHAGAYGFVMSSNYNTRPRAAEVMISQGTPVLIRARETVKDMLALEKLID